MKLEIDDRIRKLVLEYREQLRQELDPHHDETEFEHMSDYTLIEEAEVAHENEASSHVSEHLCYLRGMADAFNTTIVELIEACST